MKRYPVFVLLALLPFLGCSQPPPAPPITPPLVNGGGASGGSNMTPVAPDPTKDWYAYSAGDGSYNVKFPGKPVEKSQTIQTEVGPIVQGLVTYSTNGEKRAYLSSSITYNTIDARNYNVEKRLDAARDAGAKSMNATVDRETKIDYKGASGREVNMTMTNGGKAKTRFYIVNSGAHPSLYQLLILDLDGNIDIPSTDLFLNSLELKNP